MMFWNQKLPHLPIIVLKTTLQKYVTLLQIVDGRNGCRLWTAQRLKQRDLDPLYDFCNVWTLKIPANIGQSITT